MKRYASRSPQAAFGGGSMSGVVLGPNGSASAPTYSFINNSNTGMYTTGTDLSLAAGGSRFMRFTGTETQLAAGALNFQGQRGYSSSQALNLGASYSATKGGVTGSVVIGKDAGGISLEVEGDTDFIAGVTFNVGAILGNDQPIARNAGLYGAFYGRNSNQTANAAFLTTGTTGNYIGVCENADVATNFAHAQQTNPTLFIQSADATDIGQFSSLAWNKLGFGGHGGFGAVTKTFSFGDMTDDEGASGHIDFDENIPDGAVVQQAILHTLTGFTGDVSAVVTLGDGTDVDRYNTGTPSVFTTNASGCDLGVPSGTKWHDAAKTPRVTITSDADFTSVSAGTCTVAIFYFCP